MGSHAWLSMSRIYLELMLIEDTTIQDNVICVAIIFGMVGIVILLTRLTRGHRADFDRNKYMNDENYKFNKTFEGKEFYILDDDEHTSN